MLRKIFFSVFVFLVFILNLCVYANDLSNNVDAEREILESAQIDTDYKKEFKIDSALINSAVNLAFDKRKEYNLEEFTRLPKTKIQINVNKCKKKNTFTISSDICDYKEFVDEIIIHTNESMNYYIVPKELAFNNTDALSITVDDSDNVLEKYNGIRNVKIMKRILLAVFLIVIFAMIFFLVSLSKRKLKHNINKNMINLISFIILGLSVSSIMVLALFEPENSLELRKLSDEEVHCFTVDCSTSTEKLKGIYLGIPLYNEKFESKYISAYRNSDNTSDEVNVIGGNYDSVNDIIRFPVTKNGDYYLKNNHISFTDIKENQDGLSEAVEALAAKNIITGKAEGIFGVYDNITRAEIITMLCKMLYLDTDNADGDKFTDVSSSDWHYKYVMAGRNADLLSGFIDNSFRPNDNITRQQMAVIAASILSEMGYSNEADIEALKKYEDYEDISEWALSGIAMMNDNGINIWEEYLEPDRPLTRGEAAVILYRLYLLI